MSAIPPPGHASIIQTTGAAQRAAEQRRSEDAADATKTDAFADRLKMAVENDDRDSSVFEDAEGQGGHGGRPGEHDQPGHPPDDEESEPAKDEAGGLDISA